MHDEGLIAAVHADHIGVVAGEIDGPTAQAVLAACRRIAEHRDAIADEVLAALVAAGVEVFVAQQDPLPQRHTVELVVADVQGALDVSVALEPLGFEPWERWTGAARRSWERHADLLTLARTDDVTSVVRIRWRVGTTRSRLERLVRPTPGDWHLVTLPTWAWRAYPLVRIVRQILERIRPARRHAGSLGPFLTTPGSLLDPLLDLVDLAPGDHVVDLGCGDGRLPIAAARRGATATGIEQDPELVDLARAAVEAAGVGDRVRVDLGDARTAPLGDADIVFAFLPTDVFADLLPGVLERMRPGARLVVHEQRPLPGSVHPRPDSDHLVVSDDAISVAHRWIR